MRKAGYFISFLAVIASLALTIVSQALPNWLFVSTPKKWPARFEVSYGLYERCETDWLSLGGNGGYISHTCARFPSRTECENGNGQFCVLWSTAGYMSQLSSVFAVAAVVSIFAAALSRARRRKMWEIVATLIGLRAACQILAMSLIVHLWRTWDYPAFRNANLSSSFFINLASWILDVLISIGVAATGLAANAGHTWAAGGRAYRPIPDHAT